MLLLELRWCAECEEETALERVGGPWSPDAACVQCGAAVFLWLEEPGGAADLPWRGGQPAAISATPASAVATPAA